MTQPKNPFKPWSEKDTVPELKEAMKSRGLSIPSSSVKADLIAELSKFDNLPPPGYERDETLKRRKDALETKAEDLTNQAETVAIDPSKIKPDREILYAIDQTDGLEVSNPQPGYVYSWTYFGLHGQAIWQKKRWGWEVVTGPMPEAQEYKTEDGTRRIGDVLLMRIKKERFEQLEAAREERLLRMELGVSAEVVSLAEKYPNLFSVHTDLDKVRGPGGRKLLDVLEKKAAAQRTALKHLDSKLRKGQVEGL